MATGSSSNPSRIQEASDATAALQFALLRIGVKTLADLLVLWKRLSPAERTEATGQWSRQATRLILTRREQSRALAYAYYRLTSALMTGKTIPDPDVPTPQFVTLSALRERFASLAGPKSNDGRTTVRAATGRDSDTGVELGQPAPAGQHIPVDRKRLGDGGENQTTTDLGHETLVATQVLGSQNLRDRTKALDLGKPAREVDAQRQAAEDQAGARSSSAGSRIAMDGARDALWNLQDSDSGAIGWARISTTGHPCGFCAMLISRGAVYANEFVAEHKTAKAPSVRAGQASVGDEYHANCLPPWAAVRADGVSRLTRRDYSGPLVILTTATGEQVSVTANHPVLTDQGWIPAGQVGQGDYLIRHARREPVGRSGPREYDKPTSVEQIWRAATVAGSLDSRTVPMAPENFHGDGSDGKVDVVATDGLLARVDGVTFSQPSGELALVPGQRAGIVLPRPCGHFESGLPSRYAPHGSVGSRGDRGALFAGRADVALMTGSRMSTLSDAGFPQSTVHDDSRYAKSFSKSQYRLPSAVSRDEFFGGQIVPAAPRFDPATAEFTAKGAGAYGSLGRDLLERLAGQVELHRVVHAESVSFRGHVYNLQTAEGWYESDNHIVSNCHCIVVPVFSQSQFDNDPRFDQSRDFGREWSKVTRGLSGKDALAAWRRYIREQQKNPLAPVRVA